jgi:cytochrome c-type biogenesis protein CcmH/NrfG
MVSAGQGEEGVRQLAESVRLLPSRIDYRIDLASALRAQGRAAEAAAQLEEVLRREPDHVRARATLARLRLKDGRPGPAPEPRDDEHRLPLIGLPPLD